MRCFASLCCFLVIQQLCDCLSACRRCLSHSSCLNSGHPSSLQTLAYCLPLLQKLLQKANRKDQHQRHGGVHVGAVILVPTRELCTQVQQVLHGLIYYCDEVVKVAVLSVGRGRGDTRNDQFRVTRFRDFGPTTRSEGLPTIR